MKRLARRRWSMIATMMLAGCRPSPVAPSPLVVTPEIPAVRLPPGCASFGILELWVTPRTLLLRCADGFEDCKGTATVTIRNCTDERVGIAQIRLEPMHPANPWPGAEEVELAPGGSLGQALTMKVAGEYELSVGVIVIHDEAGDHDFVRGHDTLTVHNPARELAEAHCRACKGDWGRHGVMQREGCRCRTTDGGTPCDDGDDCQGECMRREDDEPFVCSEYRTPLGCYTALPSGWSRRRQRDPLGHVCAD